MGKTKQYGKNYQIEVDNNTYEIYSKDPYCLSCYITLQNGTLTIYKPNGTVVLDRLLYIKCITDFDSFDFWENPGVPGTYFPFSMNWVDYIPDSRLACFDGNNFLYIDLSTYEKQIRYEMVSQEIFLIDNCNIDRRKIYEILARYRKEGKADEAEQFIEDCLQKNIRAIACSPETRSQWYWFLKNCFELEQRYPEYKIYELHSFYGYALAEKDNKKGIIRLEDYEMTVQCIYDEIAYVHYSWEGSSWVKMDGKWGVQNWQTSANVLPIDYDEIKHSDDYDKPTKVKRNGKWGIVEGRTGKIMLQGKDDEIVHDLIKIYCKDDTENFPMYAKGGKGKKREIVRYYPSGLKPIKCKGLVKNEFDDIIPFNSLSGISYIAINDNGLWGLIKMEDDKTKLVEKINYSDLIELKNKYGIGDL